MESVNPDSHTRCIHVGISGIFRIVPPPNSAVHPSGVGKWVPASAGKAKAVIVHSVSGWTRGVQVKLRDPWERVPYLSAVCSRRGAIQVHVYLYVPTFTFRQWFSLLMHDTVAFHVPLTAARTHSSDNTLWSETGVCYACVCGTHYLYSRFGIFQVWYFPVLHIQCCIFQSCIFGPSSLTLLVPHFKVLHCQPPPQHGASDMIVHWLQIWRVWGHCHWVFSMIPG